MPTKTKAQVLCIKQGDARELYTKRYLKRPNIKVKILNKNVNKLHWVFNCSMHYFLSK